uniref:Putative secreted protein n=1 Tax=Anopheles marajoara TaxID=58244 RepID=A0A2M4CE42_9DIPT
MGEPTITHKIYLFIIRLHHAALLHCCCSLRETIERLAFDPTRRDKPRTTILAARKRHHINLFIKSTRTSA